MQIHAADMMSGLETWLPRHYCGPWTWSLMLVYIGSNITIGIAYFAIAAALFRVHRFLGRWGNGDRLQRLWNYSPALRPWFAAFILFCGAGHWLENVGAFFQPNYLFFATWHVLTATVSIVTAVLTWFSALATMKT